MTGYYFHVWLCLVSVFARATEVKMETPLRRGIYSRVELIGKTLNQNTTVEWKKINKSSTCLCFKRDKNDTNYIQCCGKAHFYLNNSLILENVTALNEGVYIENIVTEGGTVKSQNLTLIIEYPPNATKIVVSWTSNTSVTLRCEVNGSFLHLMWKREGVMILKEDRHSFSEGNQSLHIRNIRSSDYGTYSCIVSNDYGTSERHTDINDVNQGNGTSGGQSQYAPTVFSSALALTGVLGLLVIVIFCLYRHNKSQSAEIGRATDEGQRAENGRTTDEGDADNELGIYQEVANTEDVIPLPYVYSDFIKPKESSQTSAAAQHLEDFGYSEVGPTCTEETVVLYQVSQQVCPDTGEE